MRGKADVWEEEQVPGRSIAARPLLLSALPSSFHSALGTWGPRAAAPLFPDLLWHRRDGTRTLYLTFDDGPSPATTPALLDLLARHDARATFFLVGEPVRRHPELVRAIQAAGHTVGQHTDTHPDPWRTRALALARELATATATLEDVTGEPVRWMRPPYGHITHRLRAWCRTHGQRVAMWDAMPADFVSSATAEAVCRRTVRLARPGSLVVLHEGARVRAVTPAALAAALPRLEAVGYRFDAL